MGRMSRFVPGVVLLAALLPLRVLPAQGGPGEAIRQVETQRFALMMKRDTAALRRYMAEELVYTHSNAMVETREQHLEAIGSGKTIYESIAPVSMSYRWYDQTIAVGTGTVRSKGSLNGTPFDVTLRVTTVHVQRDLQWQLLAWQSTRIP